MDKKSIRKYIIELKKKMLEEEIDRQSVILSDRFFAQKEYIEADCLFVYASYNHEVVTDYIINRALTDGKKVALPKVAGNKMKFSFISSFDDCSQGYMGIREPNEGLISAENMTISALMLMPGLAFDRKGNRVGYGGGYYDRFLEEYDKISFFKIALGFDFQLVDNIEAESFDVGVDMIIVPSEEIRI